MHTGAECDKMALYGVRGRSAARRERGHSHVFDRQPCIFLEEDMARLEAALPGQY